MFGFHRRTRSLIPVRNLGKYEKLEVAAVEEEELEGTMLNERGSKTKQLMLVYLICIAEAIVAAGLESQLGMLPSPNYVSDGKHAKLEASKLRGVLVNAYRLGAGVSAIIWGPLTDRYGRRPIAIAGLVGMITCCFSMGFVADLPTCALLSFVAGTMGGASIVAALTMLGDLCTTTAEKAKAVSKLPVVVVCGGISQLLHKVTGASKVDGEHTSVVKGLWQRFPMLGGQIACGSLLLIMTMFASVMLEETLVQTSSTDTTDDAEKQNLIAIPRIHVVDADFNESSDTLCSAGSASSTPAAIPLPRLFKAPSLLTLLASLSLLSFHSTTFSDILPFLSSISASSPLDTRSTTAFIAHATAAVLVLNVLPRIVRRWGQLQPYRVLAASFPALYILLPLLAAPLLLTQCALSESHVVQDMFSFIALHAHHLALSLSATLAFLILLTLAPDAFSAGSVVGLLVFAKGVSAALASGTVSSTFAILTGGCGADGSGGEGTLQLAIGAVWVVALIGVAFVGIGLAAWVREGVRVDEDLPCEVLCWETCYEAGVEEEHGWELKGNEGDGEFWEPGPEEKDY